MFDSDNVNKKKSKTFIEVKPCPLFQRSGFLLKRGFLGRYSRTFFSLEGPVLRYGKSVKNNNKLKSIDLTKAFVEKVRNSKTQRKFRLFTFSSTMTLKAANPEERDAWVREIAL